MTALKRHLAQRVSYPAWQAYLAVLWLVLGYGLLGHWEIPIAVGLMVLGLFAGATVSGVWLGLRNARDERRRQT